MKSLAALLSLALSSFPGSNISAAELNGRIIITKKISKKRVTLPVYQLRGVSSPLGLEAARTIDEYRNTVVFLAANSTEPGAPVKVDMIQRNRRFEPQMLVVPMGSSVSFPNGDPIFHNVFSLSNTRKFDLGYYPDGQTRVVKFDEPGVVQVYCHLHPNMYAAIVVVPNRWYARPADDGTFSMSDIPPGKYRLVVWHMSGGFFRKQVHVTGDGIPVVMNIPVHDEDQDP
jgi:plastocyanin